MKTTIYVWSDGTWCCPEELDDFLLNDYVKVTCEVGDEEEASRVYATI